jgi:hypothetical protein
MDQGMTNSKLSGPEQGEINVTRVDSYLKALKESGGELPTENGRPNISAIAAATGVQRNAFYTNKGIKKLLADFMGTPAQEAEGESAEISYYEEKIEKLEKRVLELEQQRAADQAEKEELRSVLARYRYIEDEIIKSGRRVIL